jgi:hypothetical protein
VNTTHPKLLAGALALALLGGAQDAIAQDDPCFPRDGFSTCIASDNLWPQVGGPRWLSQASTHTAPESSAAFGLVPTYYLRPIGLRIASADPEGTTVYAVENAVASTFLLGIGVTDRLQLHLAAPVVLYQDGASKTDIVGSDQALPRSAVGDLRFGAAFAIVQRAPLEEGFGLAGRFEMAAPTGVSEAFTGFPTATYAPGLTADYHIAGFTVGVDAGARIREYVKLAGAAIGTQISASVGVSYDFFDDSLLSANLEAWALISTLQQNDLVVEPGQFVAEEQPSSTPHIPMEWMLSLRTASLIDGRFRASLGGGSFIPTGSDLPVTTPAFRLAAGVHYIFSYGDDED